MADSEDFLCDSGADTRSAGRDGLEAALRAWAADVAPQRVMFELQGAGLAAGAMLRQLEYRLDPQFLARRFAVELDQPGLSGCWSKMPREPGSWSTGVIDEG